MLPFSPLSLPTLAIFGLGPTEMIILAAIALLIFGRRLPEVGKSLGKGIVEFKRGLSGIEEDVDRAGSAPPQQPRQLPDDAPGETVERASDKSRPST